MIPLLDGDILVYERGFAVEAGWKQDHKEAGPEWLASNPPPFDWAAESMDMAIANICALAGADESPEIYLSGKTNFRYAIAKRTPYKERAGHKPYHYYNLHAYLKGKYGAITTVGMEADDALAIAATAQPSSTIICTRDKDLRQVAGNHYGWELGQQPSFGPIVVSGYGKLILDEYRRQVKGYGEAYFYFQCLTGDSTDSIPGLPGIGPIKAFNILQATASSTEAYKAVLEAYRVIYGDDSEAELLEQGRLLYMTRYLDEWGLPIMWELPI